MKWPKLTINIKLLLSYLGMALLTVMVGIYAVFSLEHLNRLAFAITNEDFAVLETSKNLMDLLLSQESAEKKYLIFKDPNFADIFWLRNREFKDTIEHLKRFRLSGLPGMVNGLSALEKEYEAFFKKELTLIEDNNLSEASLLSEKEGKKLVEAMAFLIRKMGKKAEEDIDRHMAAFQKQGKKAARITITLSIISLFAGFLLTLLITYNIARPLKKLEQATMLIAEGKFKIDLNMNRADAIGSLARAFLVMADRLKVLEAYHRDASPLTGMPGNLAIERHIQDRIKAKKPFALCHLDLDNFKPFADHYGYAWGSEVIKETGRIIAKEATAYDHKEVFVGHIGGDDFVVIAEPNIAEDLCRAILKEFDTVSKKFYSPEEIARGYFTGKDRQGVIRNFPLITMTISIVVDEGGRFANPLDMAAEAAKLKEYAKTLPGSNYVKREDLPHSDLA